MINLENKGYDETWGPASAAPYLSQTLRSQGVLLNQYFGTAHNSQPNYVAQISGQGPNAQMQADCQNYSPFVGSGTASPGQAVGGGCVFPASLPTVAGQLTAAGKTWKGYMEDMGTPCRHPAQGAVDDTQKAKVGDQYAARHNPFVYFAGITGSPDRAKNDVDLSALKTDLASAATTPNLSMITSNLCHDGHDSPCVDGQPGASPARTNGLSSGFRSSPPPRRSRRTASWSSPSTKPTGRRATPARAAVRAPGQIRRCQASPAWAEAGSAPWSSRRSPRAAT